MLNKFSIFTWILLSINLTAIAAPTEKVLDIQTWQTSNGATVYFTPSSNLPMLDINILFDAGSARDGEHSGLATLTNALLSEGTTQLSADQIADRFDSVGAQFETNSDRDMARLTLRTLVENRYLTPALTTLTAVLTQANFPDGAFARVQNQQLRAIEQNQQSPAMIAQAEFFQELYGGTPYAHAVLGTATTVSALNKKDVTAFYKKYYVAKNATIILVGNINKTQANTIAEQLSKNLPVGEKPAALTAIKPRPIAFYQHIEFPTAQTHILIGQVGINLQNADFFPLYVGNHILGGSGLVSLLFAKIREQHGLSYSIYSAWQPLAANGPFLINLQTRNAQTTQAVTMTQQVLNDFISQGPTAAELNAAKQNLLGSFALRLDSNTDIAQYLSLIAFYHLPLDYLDTFRSRIDAVSSEDIQQAFKKHINPKTLTTITVGQANATKAG